MHWRSCMPCVWFLSCTSCGTDMSNQCAVRISCVDSMIAIVVTIRYGRQPVYVNNRGESHAVHCSSDPLHGDTNASKGLHSAKSVSHDICGFPVCLATGLARRLPFRAYHQICLELAVKSGLCWPMEVTLSVYVCLRVLMLVHLSMSVCRVRLFVMTISHVCLCLSMFERPNHCINRGMIGRT